MTSRTPPAELGDHLGYWLRFVSNHVSHAFAQKLAGQGVTVAEWALMRVLYESGAAAPSTLATTMGLTRGAVTKLADRLVTELRLPRVLCGALVGAEVLLLGQ